MSHDRSVTVCQWLRFHCSYFLQFLKFRQSKIAISTFLKSRPARPNLEEDGVTKNFASSLEVSWSTWSRTSCPCVNALTWYSFEIYFDIRTSGRQTVLMNEIFLWWTFKPCSSTLLARPFGQVASNSQDDRRPFVRSSLRPRTNYKTLFFFSPLGSDTMCAVYYWICDLLCNSIVSFIKYFTQPFFRNSEWEPHDALRRLSECLKSNFFVCLFF